MRGFGPADSRARALPTGLSTSARAREREALGAAGDVADIFIRQIVKKMSYRFIHKFKNFIMIMIKR